MFSRLSPFQFIRFSGGGDEGWYWASGAERVEVERADVEGEAGVGRAVAVVLGVGDTGTPLVRVYTEASDLDGFRGSGVGGVLGALFIERGVSGSRVLVAGRVVGVVGDPAPDRRPRHVSEAGGRPKAFPRFDRGNERLEVLGALVGCQVSGGSGGLWHSASMLRLMFGVCQKDNASVLAFCGVAG